MRLGLRSGSLPSRAILCSSHFTSLNPHTSPCLQRNTVPQVAATACFFHAYHSCSATAASIFPSVSGREKFPDQRVQPSTVAQRFRLVNSSLPANLSCYKNPVCNHLKPFPGNQSTTSLMERLCVNREGKKISLCWRRARLHCWNKWRGSYGICRRATQRLTMSISQSVKDQEAARLGYSDQPVGPPASGIIRICDNPRLLQSAACGIDHRPEEEGAGTDCGLWLPVSLEIMTSFGSARFDHTA